jgi:hypothetical protein
MEPTTPMKAIRLKCLDCSAGSAHEVRLCGIKACSLYRYRMGKNPAYARRVGNPKALQRAREAAEGIDVADVGA